MNILKIVKFFYVFIIQMPKPHSHMTISELKHYIRSHGLHRAKIKLSQNKAGLVADLKKHGHWESGKAKRTGGAPTHPVKKPKPKPKKKAEKKVETVHEAYLRHKKDNSQLTTDQLKKSLSTAKNRSAETLAHQGQSLVNSDKGFIQFAEEELAKRKPSMVEIKVGDKASMKKGVKKLTETVLSKAKRDIDEIHKEFTLAKARKELKKSKVDFVKFLDRSNEAGEKLNSIIDTINKGIKADKISDDEASSLRSKIKKTNAARKQIAGELQKAFDSKEEFQRTLKKAGIKTLKR
jgi:hypothetical protein